MYYLCPFLFKPLFGCSLLLHYYWILWLLSVLCFISRHASTHTFTGKIWWRTLSASQICVCVCKRHCLFTHSSPGPCCRIEAYNLPVLAHVIYLYCICSLAVHSFLRSLLQMRAYLYCLFPAGTGLEGMRAYRESMQGSERTMWKGREGGCLESYRVLLGPVFPTVFPINLGRKFQTSLA